MGRLGKCGTPGSDLRPRLPSGYYIDEESGSVEGPFVHAFDCVSKYVSSAWALRNRYVHDDDDDVHDELRLASDEELRQASDVSIDELPS